MTRAVLIAIFTVTIMPGLARGQDQPRFYRIDANTPEGLQKLFRYDGQAMPLVSAHRGGALVGIPGKLHRDVRAYAPAYILHSGNRPPIHERRPHRPAPRLHARKNDDRDRTRR